MTSAEADDILNRLVGKWEKCAYKAREDRFYLQRGRFALFRANIQGPPGIYSALGEYVPGEDVFHCDDPVRAVRERIENARRSFAEIMKEVDGI